MKKLLLTTIVLAMVFGANAQKNLSISIGFDVPTAGAALPGFEDVILADGESIPDTTALVASLNAGPSIQLRYNNWINENVALGIDLEYLPGLLSGDFHTYLGPGVIAVNTVTGKMFNVSPMVTMSTNNSEAKALYTKFGLTLGFGISTKVETEIDALQVSVVQELTKGLAVGFKGGVGARTSLSDKLSLFGELELTSLMHQPKELSTVSTSPLGTVSIIENIVETTGPNSPATDRRTFAVPYSSIALNFGLTFSL